MLISGNVSPLAVIPAGVIYNENHTDRNQHYGKERRQQPGEQNVFCTTMLAAQQACIVQHQRTDLADFPRQMALGDGLLHLQSAQAIGAFVVVFRTCYVTVNILFVYRLGAVGVGGGGHQLPHLFPMVAGAAFQNKVRAATGAGFIVIVFCLTSVVVHIGKGPTAAPRTKQSYHHNERRQRHKHGIPSRQYALGRHRHH